MTTHNNEIGSFTFRGRILLKIILMVFLLCWSTMVVAMLIFWEKLYLGDKLGPVIVIDILFLVMTAYLFVLANNAFSSLTINEKGVRLNRLFSSKEIVWQDVKRVVCGEVTESFNSAVNPSVEPFADVYDRENNSLLSLRSTYGNKAFELLVQQCHSRGIEVDGEITLRDFEPRGTHQMIEESSSFPDSLVEVPVSERCTQRFGWQMWNWGSMLLLATIIGCIEDENVRKGSMILFPLALGFGGLALIIHEFRRRLRRSTLVAREHEVGIYRSGRLETVLPRSAIIQYSFSGINTVQIAFLFTVIGALGCFSASMAESILGKIIVGYGGIICLSTLISSLRTRCRSVVFILPGKKYLDEWIMLPPDEAERLM